MAGALRDKSTNEGNRFRRNDDVLLMFWVFEGPREGFPTFSSAELPVLLLFVGGDTLVADICSCCDELADWPQSDLKTIIEVPSQIRTHVR